MTANPSGPTKADLADLAEVEAMLEAGILDPAATRSALEYMAGAWLAAQVRKRERYAARRNEVGRHATRASAAMLATVERVSQTIAARRGADWAHLFDRDFALPGGGRVSWRDATVEQHVKRAVMLEVMAAGDLETAALHRQAIADIRSAGAYNLGGIEAAA